ncbi:hypothetical protein KP79_PYT18073 [Mizuhopecten yessoensis]|uniref:K Homology domain-containing protein n=1 Tax=Mizuhopecten yessoensis TaxID=6573 RepID=A0A210PV98_MIZYE|nr:hypothetical protein KP79_PYT18073 [Mizuhopecten yessoensis]
MAASMLIRGYRLRRVSNFSLTNIAKCIFRDKGFPRRPGACLFPTNEGNGNGIRRLVGTRNLFAFDGNESIPEEKVGNEVFGFGNIGQFTETVFTEEDVDFHFTIYKGIIGKWGQNLRRLRSETGLHFDVKASTTALLVSGSDAETAKKATEIITQEVQLFKKWVRKVLTVEDADIRDRIFCLLLGERGHNLKRLQMETGSDFGLDFTKTSLIITKGLDRPCDEAFNRATEKVKQDAQLLKTLHKKVFVDEDVDVYHHIRRCFIKDIEQKVTTWKLETGKDLSDFDIEYIKTGFLVYGNSAEVVKIITEKVRQNIKRIKNLTKTVTTDEDNEFHHRIFHQFFGKNNHNLRKVKSLSGVDFQVSFATKRTVALVSGSNSEELKKAVEVVTREIQLIKYGYTQ